MPVRAWGPLAAPRQRFFPDLAQSPGFLAVLFTSYVFLILFLPITLALFYGLRRLGWGQWSVSALVVASWVFYGYWDMGYLGLLIASILVNYILGRLIARRDPFAMTLLALGVGANLSVLVIVKYLDFLGENLSRLVGFDYTLMNFLLPIGISFFTFQNIAYLVDCYKTGKAEESLRDYALFISFFPQLIAGPIVHHAYTRPQFSALAGRGVDGRMVAFGLIVFALGLFKKTMLADPIARAVDPLYAAAAAGQTLSFGDAWTAAVGFSLQLYFDFSGYSDMAIGLAALFGVRLPVNFRSPYKATSIVEFWRRWHITLSNFLRDYIYIPLGGNRFGEGRRLINIFTTMFIGGIWHGAAWTFVLWGALHAAAITAQHALEVLFPAIRKLNNGPGRHIGRLALLLFLIFTWVIFRAEGTDAAFGIWHSMVAGDWGLGLGVPGIAIDHLVVAALIALFAPDTLDLVGYTDNRQVPWPPQPENPVQPRLRPSPAGAAIAGLCLAAALAVAWKPAIFIYFNF